MQIFSRPCATLIASASLLAACSSAVQGDYAGDPQFTIRGVLSGPAPSPTPSAPSIGILWYDFAASGDLSAGEVLPITATSFPANFSFDLLALPPAPALNVFHDSGGAVDGVLGIGYILAFDDVDGDGTFAPNAGGDGVAAPDQLIGRVNDQVLVYVDTRPADGSMGAALFTDPSQLLPGYQLVAGICTAGARDRLTTTGAGVQLLLGADVPESSCIDVF